MAVSPSLDVDNQKLNAIPGYIKSSVIFISCFWTLNQAAYFFTLKEGLSTFYPPSGFAMFMVYYLGPKYLPIHFLAILLGGLPQRDVFNYNLEMFLPDLRQFLVYAIAGLALRWLNKDKGTLHPVFCYSAVIASAVTALVSALLFTVNIDKPASSYDFEWLASTSSFFIGNLTGAVFILPLFMLFEYAQESGLGQLRVDFFSRFLALDKALLLVFTLILVFSIVSLDRISAGFSNYYYFMLVPIIWAAVKWGFCVGVFYAFLANLFALSLSLIYDDIRFSSMEGQVLF